MIMATNKYLIKMDIPVKSELVRARISEPTSADSIGLSNLQLATMAIAAAVTVANLYYCQPLPSQIARSLHMTARETADIPCSLRSATPWDFCFLRRTTEARAPNGAHERLTELNLGAAQSADLPSDDLCRVISELFDQDDFERYNERRANQGDAKPEYFADVQLALLGILS